MILSKEHFRHFFTLLL